MDKLSDADIIKMKQEALKRASEAKKKSSITEKLDTDKTKNSTGKNNQATQSNDTLSPFIYDSEQMLILILIMLLADEGADMGLILALMYLIL